MNLNNYQLKQVNIDQHVAISQHYLKKYTYIYIYRERERETYLKKYIICIYMYVCIETYLKK